MSLNLFRITEKFNQLLISGYEINGGKKAFEINFSDKTIFLMSIQVIFGFNKFLAPLSGTEEWSLGSSVTDLYTCNMVLTILFTSLIFPVISFFIINY